MIKALFGFISPYLDTAKSIIAAVAVVVVVLGLFWLHHKIDKGGYDRRAAEQVVIDAKAKAKADKETADLQANADKLRGEKDAQIAILSNQRDAALASLRARPARPSAPASDGQTATGCTGSQLYRDDGEFLVREAARADEIRIALKVCYAEYDAARKAGQ